MSSNTQKHTQINEVKLFEQPRQAPSENIFKHRYDPSKGEGAMGAMNAIDDHLFRLEATLNLLLSQFEDVDEDQRLSENYLTGAIYSALTYIEDIKAITSSKWDDSLPGGGAL